MQILVTIGRKWSTLWQEPLTREKWSLANNASFFVGVPPAVFLHELGHALAVWLFGGQVIEFAYRVFWGYVVPVGSFTAAEDWFISVAGTLGNVLFGMAVWLWSRTAHSSTIRYFGLQTFRYQLYFGFIYYPIFTLFLPIGDWITIYDFGSTPILSGLTAVFHVAILLLFWQASRQGWFEQTTHESVADQHAFEQQAATAAANPQDLRAQLAYIDALRSGNAPNRARHAMRHLLEQHPNSASAWLRSALLHPTRSGSLSGKGMRQVQKAMTLGLSQPDEQVLAQLLLGTHAMEREKMETAVSHFSQAIQTQTQLPNSTRKENMLANLHYLRAQAQRRLKQFENALTDVKTAVSHAQATDNKKLLEKIAVERQLIQQHPERKQNSTTYLDN